MLAKIVDGKILYANKIVRIGGKLICNPTEEFLLANGYKEVIADDYPTLKYNCQSAQPHYEDVGDKIIKKWEITPDDETARMIDLTRARTEQEGIVAICRSLAKSQVATSDDKTLGIACMALFPPWERGKYAVGDVRTDPKTGYPHECITPHDSIANPDYTIDNRTLWTPWHSHSADYALPYEQPTGAHDMYKYDEYMIWTDKQIYKAVTDTVYSPDVRPEDWALTEN